MKIKKDKMILGVFAIIILISSLAFMLCDIYLPLNLWVHPVLNFFFAILVGFGVVYIVFAFVKKSSWYFFLSAAILSPALFYALINYTKWWIAIIIVAVFAMIICLLRFVVSSKDENIALNDTPDYKNYEQRKAEEQLLKGKEESEELPEIKSFK